ncbi:hypothetical protein PybrP1_007095 [[Pythium] brassicae (nom. inval.)]|nr:hypothetical protein PybrP1_007095 [[Pythium] brassicae (nom. inval.)]
MLALTKTVATIAAAVALLASWAPTRVGAVDPVFRLGVPKYNGSGCPPGSIGMATSSDGQTVSVLFSEYGTSAAGPRVERKACSLLVPVDVLPGISIGIFKADYRGYAYVPSAPSDSYVDFNATYFFAGAEGPTYRKKWGPKTNEELFLSHKMTATSIAWSGCRPATILRINTAISAFKGPAPLASAGDDPMITIDSADLAVEKGIQFYLTYKRC